MAIPLHASSKRANKASFSWDDRAGAEAAAGSPDWERHISDRCPDVLRPSARGVLGVACKRTEGIGIVQSGWNASRQVSNNGVYAARIPWLMLTGAEAKGRLGEAQ